MSELTICQECGAGVPAGAPGGLCPRCLMNAGLAGSTVSEVQVGTAVAALSAEAFKRAIIELGIVDAPALDRTAGGRACDLPELVKSLIQAQVLTAYQACAIQQGKSRGLVVGRYLILDKLGQGGMGVVFKARHRLLDRVVALKILPPSFARRPELVLRFRREMQTTARLSHPNVVSVLDADEDRGIYFLAMEYIEGRDLDHLIRDCGAFPVEQALDCVIQAARGLEAAHARGIIHRDIKPANLMLDSSGTVRVLDLGLARLVDDGSSFGQTTSRHLTRSGIFMGTVDFMAPEQAEDSHNVDHRADIYSLGCSLYFLLCARPPFDGATLISRLMAHQEQSAPSLRAIRPEISEAVDAAYLAMMAKRPEDRPQSMGEVIALLDSCPKGPGGAGLRASLHSFSSTVLHFATPLTARDTPTVFIAREESGGFRFEAGPEIEVSELADPSSELRRSADAVPVPASSGVRPAYAGLGPLGLAALGVSAAVVIFIVAYFVGLRRGAEIQSPPAAEVVKLAPARDNGGIPAPNELIETVSNVPEPPTKPAADSPDVAPKKPPETPPTEASADIPARPEITDVEKPRPKVVKVPTYKVVPAFTAHEKGVNSIVVRGDGKVALTAGADRTARVWEVATGKQIFEFKHPSEVMVATMSADGRLAVTATKGLRNRNGHLRRWNLSTGEQIHGSPMPELHAGSIPAVVFLPDGRGLTGGEDGQVILWHFDTGRPIGTLGNQKGSIHPHTMAIFSHGRRAMTGGDDGLVHLWNLAIGRQVENWKAHDGPVSSISISHDGGRVATGGGDGNVILWDVARHSELRRFSMPDEDRVQSVAILRDGNVLAAGGSRGHLVLWNGYSGAMLRQAEPPLAPHSDMVALPPDGRRVLTADQEGTVRIWTPHE